MVGAKAFRKDQKSSFPSAGRASDNNSLLRIDEHMLASKILGLEAAGFVYVLAFLVAYSLLTARINLRGLLLDKSGSGRVRPERLQLLLSTIAFAAKYVNDSSTSTTALPHIDFTYLYLLGGSHGIYISRKLYEGFWLKRHKS